MCLMCFKVNACVLALYGLCAQCACEARAHLCLSGTAVTDLHFCAFLKAQEVDRQGCKHLHTVGFYAVCLVTSAPSVSCVLIFFTFASKKNTTK